MRSNKNRPSDNPTEHKNILNLHQLLFCYCVLVCISVHIIRWLLFVHAPIERVEWSPCEYSIYFMLFNYKIWFSSSEYLCLCLCLDPVLLCVHDDILKFWILFTASAHWVSMISRFSDLIFGLLSNWGWVLRFEFGWTLGVFEPLVIKW